MPKPTTDQQLADIQTEQAAQQPPLSDPPPPATPATPSPSSSAPSAPPSDPPQLESAQPEQARPDPLVPLARSPRRTTNPMNDGPNEAIEDGQDPTSVLNGAASTSGIATAVDRPTAGRRAEEDPRLVREWKDPEQLCEAIEAYVGKSHGLTPDLEFMRKVAGHIRAIVGAPDPDDRDDASQR